MSLLGLARRFYSSGSALGDAAKAALESSTPRAVRIRRERFPKLLSKADEGSTLSNVEKTAYDRLKSRGELIVEGPDGPRELSEEEWLERTNAKRRRVRGTKQAATTVDSLDQTPVVGHRIYLPNIIFRLVRNHTPPGEPYNPYEATFRVPQSLTKLDIRGYLLSMYGVRTTYIRTDNRIADIRRSQTTFSKGRWDSEDTYKRAVVGLEEPFYFPQAREDMDAKEREERDKYLNSKFELEQVKEMRDRYRIRLFKPTGYRNSGRNQTLRGKIIRKVMEQKLARENVVATAVKDMLSEPAIAGRLPVVPSTNS
jgi:large subunit ribosomal protein L23